MFTADEKRYSTMVYRRCGNSGLKLPAISLGMWQNFGDFKPYENSQKMLRKAFDLGITHFDLANNYGPSPGSAELTMGKALKDSFGPYRNELIISTKAGYWSWNGPYGEWGSRKNLLASLDNSLKRMGLDYVDVFYSHRFDPETPLEETMSALAQAVHSGKALYVGVSNYDDEQTAKANEILNKMGIHCLIHQPRYSMFCRGPEEKLFPTLQNLGIGSIAYCPLDQGMLTTRYLNGLPEDSRAAISYGTLKEQQVTKDKLEKVRQLNKIAENRGQSMAQLALTWALRDGAATSVIIGASRVEQIVENAAVINHLDLSSDELNEIESILSK